MFSYQGSSTHKDNRGSVVVVTEVGDVVITVVKLFSYYNHTYIV